MRSKHDAPNVLLIMDDQHRYDYLRCAGAQFLHTPNIDRLAARGTMLSQCVTNSPSCVPARIGLAIGLQPGRTGLLRSTSYLPRQRRTLYQHFRDCGYRVGLVGKADLAKPDAYNGIGGDRPASFMWGFTHPFECEGKMHAGRAKRPLGPYTAYLDRRRKLQRFVEDYRARRERGWILGASHDSVLAAKDFEDVFIGRHAVEWLKTVDDDFPWFLSVNFVGPHPPFDPPREFARRRHGGEPPAPVSVEDQDKPQWLRKRNLEASVEQVRQTRHQYCALIELIDALVGDILGALESRGWAESTVVVFTSDHGEMLGDRGFYGKTVMYEPSLRVPLILAGPGISRRESDALVELIDLNPTLVEIAGLPAQTDLDAESFAPVLTGAADSHRQEALSFLENCQAVRTAELKYIENTNDIAELYDLRSDTSEARNLAASDPDTVREFRGRLRRRLRSGTWFR